MTQYISEKPPFKEERIEDIHDLSALKKYACQKIKFMKDWYMQCMDCPDKKCKTGRQVDIIMENETKPQEKDPIRKQIVDIFSQKDPVKALLESFSKLRPPSVYAKVNAWRRRYPDLEEQYHMIEKVRFLWTKQYESMTIPDILKQLYPTEVIDIDVASMHPTSIVSAEPFSAYSFTQMAPNSKIVTVKPDIDKDADGDSISLEDFLVECGEKEETDKDILKEEKAPTSMQVSASDSMDILLKNLYSEKGECEIRLQEIQRKIDAVNMVKELMHNAMAQKG